MRTTAIGAVALATASCVSGGSTSLEGRPTKRIEVSSWSRDDGDAADTTYMYVVSPQSDGDLGDYVDGTAFGVHVESPCADGDLMVARFVGQAKGAWEYRASIRLTVQHSARDDAAPIDVTGAQSYITRLPLEQDVRQIYLQGASEYSGPDGECRFSIKAKTFTGTMELFGSASLMVERYAPDM